MPEREGTTDMQTSRLRSLAALAAILIAVIAAAASTSDENTAKKVDGETGETSDATGDEVFKVGDKVELGDWQIVVHAVTDPVVPTNEFITPDEGNRWVTVDTEVFNQSSEPSSVSSILCFELQDSENRNYDITITSESTTASLDGEVDAGASRRGDLSFEVPEAATGLKLRFKCELFSSGTATIELS